MQYLTDLTTRSLNEIRHFKSIWSKSPIPKSPFTKSPFAKRLMLVGNQLGVVSVYTSVESDKKSFGLVLSDVIYH